MSVLLLTNPYAQQAGPPASATAAAPPSGAPETQVVPPDAVQPSARGQQAGESGDATAFAGFGAGAGGEAAQQPLLAPSSTARPPDAAPKSVVNAQVAEAQNALPGEPEEVILPAPTPEMPDPLPTSPFLKRVRDG